MKAANPTIKDVERYWDARPCNVRHSRSAVGSVEWSAGVTERKYAIEPHIVPFADFSRWRGKEVLEVGAGIGTDTLEFARAGAAVTVVELSAESLSLLERRVALAGLGKRVYVNRGNAEEHIPSGSSCGYDLAYAFGVLHHSPNPQRIVWNVFQRLRVGGEFRLMLYAKWSLKNLIGDQYEAQSGCPVVHKYSAAEARALMEGAGFTVLSIRKRHIFRWRVREYVEHKYVERFGFRFIPRWAERVLGEHLLVVARKDIPSHFGTMPGKGFPRRREV